MKERLTQKFKGAFAFQIVFYSGTFSRLPNSQWFCIHQKIKIKERWILIIHYNIKSYTVSNAAV